MTIRTTATIILSNHDSTEALNSALYKVDGLRSENRRLRSLIQRIWTSHNPDIGEFDTDEALKTITDK